MFFKGLVYKSRLYFENTQVVQTGANLAVLCFLLVNLALLRFYAKMAVW